MTATNHDTSVPPLVMKNLRVVVYCEGMKSWQPNSVVDATDRDFKHMYGKLQLRELTPEEQKIVLIVSIAEGAGIEELIIGDTYVYPNWEGGPWRFRFGGSIGRLGSENFILLQMGQVQGCVLQAER